MMIELGDDDVGQRAEGRLAPGNGFCRRRRLHDLLAGPTAILGPDGSNDAPLQRHGIEHLVAILAQRPQRAAAVGTGAVALLGFDPLLFAWQMGGQCPNRRWPIDGYWTASTRGGHNGLAFELFKRQFKLCDLGIELLGRLAELHPLEARDLHAQRVDQDVTGRNIGVGGRQSSFELGDPSVFVSGGKACVRHHDPIAEQRPQCQKKHRKMAVLARE